MRVLHILHRSVPGTHGYAIRSQEIVKNQLAKGLEPLVITSPSQLPAGSLDSEGAEYIAGVRYFRTGNDLLPATAEVHDPSPLRSSFRVLQNAFLFTSTLRIAKKYKPAVIHSHSPFTCGIIGDVVGKLRCVPKIYEMRGIWEDSHTSRHGLSAQSLRYRGVRALETEAALNADVLCVISDALRQEMVSRGVDEGRIVVVPNGVDVGRFTPGAAPEALIERLGLAGKVVIGYIGSFFRYEGLDLLARAFSGLAGEFPDLRLLLVGDGELKGELESILTKAGTRDKAILTGKVKHSEVEDYYRLCDLMVLPRRDTRETRLVTPLKPMEIMAMEKALLVSDIGGHREIVQDERNGLFFKAEDVNDLTAKIRLLLTNQTLHQDLASRGRKWVKENCDWAVLVNRYIEVYERLVRGGT
jgi:PEP-CTERM/exosortase A-associated glycosyltransferase